MIFHASYLNRLKATIASGPLPQMTPQQAAQFKNALYSAESAGLRTKSFGSSLVHYPESATADSDVTV